MALDLPRSRPLPAAQAIEEFVADDPASERRWAAALDELEANIDRFAAVALSAYTDIASVPLEVPDAYVLPGDLGPIPRSLRERADDVRGRSEAAHTEVFRVRDLVGKQLAGLSRAPKANAYHDDADGSYLDQLG